jgi:hypothetical protein
VARPRFQYRSPNFDAPPLQGAPDARFEGAPADGVLPDGFFSTTNLPTYVRVGGAWRRPRLPRMDCVIMLHPEGDLVVVEPRKVKRGQRVAVGASEDGSEGIYVHAEGFLGGRHSANEFRFMQTEVSREKPVDYSMLAELLGEEKQRGGRILWVIGPALVHARAREDMIWFIDNGYVGTLLGGNAVAVHDLEAAIFGTTLGMSSSGEGVEGGHALHMRAINTIRRAGSIEACRLDSRRRAAARSVLRYPCGTGRHARPYRRGDLRGFRGDGAACDRGRQHAAGIRGCAVS